MTSNADIYIHSCKIIAVFEAIDDGITSEAGNGTSWSTNSNCHDFAVLQ